MKGIETTYKGIKFRSRLESKWARFFDLLSWRWEYEPFDLNGYIPDFVLIGKKRSTLVEVKPYEKLEQFAPAIDKYRKSIIGTDHWDKEILLLGTAPLLIKNCSMGEHLGWINERTYDTDGDFVYFNPAVFNNSTCGAGFINSIMSYEDRITGEYDGNGHLCPQDYDEIESLWAIATNGARYDRV